VILGGTERTIQTKVAFHQSSSESLENHDVVGICIMEREEGEVCAGAGRVYMEDKRS